MIGGGGWLVGCIVMMMPGTTVAEFPCGRLRRKPPPNIQAITSSASQTNTQVKVNAVILDQGVQKVEYRIEQFRGDLSSWLVRRSF